MRRLIRLITQPSVFFNQLQWSRSHWFILFFLGVFCLAETRTQSTSGLYLQSLEWLQVTFGVGLDSAIWMLSALRLSFMFAGVFLVTELIWFVGNVIGEKGSKRVLLRRLAIVFTVFLAAASVQNLSFTQPWFIVLSAALYVWATVLGFYAIREQFSLNSLETAIVSVLAALVVSASLHVTDHATKLVAGAEADRPAITDRSDREGSPFLFEN